MIMCYASNASPSLSGLLPAILGGFKYSSVIEWKPLIDICLVEHYDKFSGTSQEYCMLCSVVCHGKLQKQGPFTAQSVLESVKQLVSIQWQGMHLHVPVAI